MINGSRAARSSFNHMTHSVSILMTHSVFNLMPIGSKLLLNLTKVDAKEENLYER